MRRTSIFLCLLLISLLSWGKGFISTDGVHLINAEGKPYYFIGTNFWYGPILASDGQGGNKQRLNAELDRLKSLGIENLRILVGADAGSKNANTVRPILQKEDGSLNDTLLIGLDRLLVELDKRDMTAVLYLTNSWDWSGGFGYYLKRTGHADSPNASGKGYDDYVNYAADFSRDKKAQNLFYDFVKKIVSRTNTVNGLPYKEQKSIMSWQICNEPRPFAKDNFDSFYDWVTKTAKLIKSIDPNHLVSVGSEGIYGCEKSEELYRRIHSVDDIDYLTIHIWPVNWGWATRDNLYNSLKNVYVCAGEYLNLHLRMAEKINKPLVVEEFGYSRDKNFYQPGSATVARNAFYRFIFEKVEESKNNKASLAGCNFWGWGGLGKPSGLVWKLGDDYLCDPPHEPQGWYSVYDSDSSTVNIIQQFTNRLR